MSLEAVTAVGLIALPLAFNVAYAELARTFDYPDILRRPTGEVLAAFTAGGAGLLIRWWIFVITAVTMIPLVVLVGQILPPSPLNTVATIIGVLAGVVQSLGLVRWPFAVPYLARTYQDPDADQATKQAAEVQFQVLNRLLGVGIGEHLGYLLTGTWTILIATAMLNAGAYPAWLAVVGMLVGTAQVVGSFEFVGPNEPTGWAAAARIIPTAYVVWSLWLVAIGVGLFIAM